MDTFSSMSKKNLMFLYELIVPVVNKGRGMIGIVSKIYF